MVFFGTIRRGSHAGLNAVVGLSVGPRHRDDGGVIGEDPPVEGLVIGDAGSVLRHANPSGSLPALQGSLGIRVPLHQSATDAAGGNFCVFIVVGSGADIVPMRHALTNRGPAAGQLWSAFEGHVNDGTQLLCRVGCSKGSIVCRQGNVVRHLSFEDGIGVLESMVAIGLHGVGLSFMGVREVIHSG